jgi:hypothetical protein
MLQEAFPTAASTSRVMNNPVTSVTNSGRKPSMTEAIKVTYRGVEVPDSEYYFGWNSEDNGSGFMNGVDAALAMEGNLIAARVSLSELMGRGE